MGCTARVSWKIADISELEKDAAIFALEPGGTAIGKFQFPDRGAVILGNEELGVSPAAMRIADSRLGRVSIPTYGEKGSLNVATAFGILMFAWTQSVLSQQPHP